MAKPQATVSNEINELHIRSYFLLYRAHKLHPHLLTTKLAKGCLLQFHPLGTVKT
jgi:hypothetical protein